MPHSARWDSFTCGISDIAPAAQRYYIRRNAREANITRQKPNITAEGNITRRTANITEKALAAQVLFHGGAGGSRTHVRKPILTIFSGCSLSFVLPAFISGRQDMKVGIFLVSDGCKRKLAVHFCRLGYARTEPRQFTARTGRS